jgi:hypothetical protein
VYHKRHFAARRPNTAEGTDPLCDSSTVNIAALGLERQDHDPEINPLCCLRLECLGLDCSPGQIWVCRRFRSCTVSTPADVSIPAGVTAPLHNESDPPAYPSSSNRFRQNGKRISVPRLQFGVDWIARRGARVGITST